MRSIHFPPREDPPTKIDEVKVERTDTLDVLSAAVRESRLIHKTMAGILASGDRHGAYQVARSAALRLIEYLNNLVDVGE